MRLFLRTSVVLAVCLIEMPALRPAPVSARGESVPAAILQLTLPEGGWAVMTIRDGEEADLQWVGKAHIGLKAQLKGETVSLDVLEYSTDPTQATEPPTLAWRFELVRGKRQSFAKDFLPFDVVWIGTKTTGALPKTVPACTGCPTARLVPKVPCIRCCITCDGWTACACEIMMACGGCCCPNCCDARGAA
jgi:hypothetical protein